MILLLAMMTVMGKHIKVQQRIQEDVIAAQE